MILLSPSPSEIQHFFHRMETFSLFLECEYEREENVETNKLYPKEKDQVELKLYIFDLLVLTKKLTKTGFF